MARRQVSRKRRSRSSLKRGSPLSISSDLILLQPVHDTSPNNCQRLFRSCATLSTAVSGSSTDVLALKRVGMGTGVEFVMVVCPLALIFIFERYESPIRVLGVACHNAPRFQPQASPSIFTLASRSGDAATMGARPPAPPGKKGMSPAAGLLRR